MKDLTPFSLKEIQRKLNSINVKINVRHKRVFPKEKFRLLSFYQYKRRFVNISPQGYFSFSKLATSFIDFSNFKKQIKPGKFDEIFHILVEIVKRVGLITGKILSYDGTLFPTFANYRGCNYACEECKRIS